MRAVDCVGEAGETRAFTEEFRAHRDYDMHVDLVRRSLAILIGVAAADEVDEQLRLLAARLLLEAEQFLELIDEDAQAPAFEAS